MRLIVASNVKDPDSIYQKLVALHEGLSEDESQRVNARLVLLLVNHIGDAEAIDEAFALARLPDQPMA